MGELKTQDYGSERATSMVGRNTATDMLVGREAQEVQGMMVMAKRFPRDQVLAYNRTIEACKRPGLAEKAIYEYPRGGERVTGPSIRLAEALAQNWGNIDYGWMELEQANGESHLMAYAWDVETNTRQSRMFTVKHIRHSTKKGDVKLTDPRDIYELCANQAARRVRACILGVIPGDVIEAAVDQCGKTLAGESNVPVIDQVRAMAKHFKDEFGVTLPQIEKYIGWKAESFSRNDLVRLKRVYNSLHDGMASKEDIFDMKAGADDDKPKDAFLTEKKEKEPAPEKASAKAMEKAAQATARRRGRTKKAEKQEEPPASEYEQYEMMMNGMDTPEN